MSLEIREQLLELARLLDDYRADMEHNECEERRCLTCEWAYFCEHGWPPGRAVSVLRTAAKR